MSIDEQTLLLPDLCIEDSTNRPNSTQLQTITNTLNLVMGVGMVSLPFAFAKLGWVFSFTLLFLFCIISVYTASLIGKLMQVPMAGERTDRYPINFYDIAYLAFGKTGRVVMGLLFVLELFTASVAMIILFADSVVVLAPSMEDSKNVLMSLAIAFLTPITWQRSLSKLSMLSFIGVFAIGGLLFTVVFDGFAYNQHPGSILNPASTSLFPKDIKQVGLGLGLLIVGLDGHSVFPSLYLDMIEPKKFTQSISISYATIGIVYLIMGTAGYLMFGQQVLPEVICN